MKGIQYTIRGIPEEVDTSLREEAALYGKSLNALLVEKLSESAHPAQPPTNGLEKFIGTMVFDPGFEEAIAECGMIHPDDWPELDLPPHPLQGVPHP